MKAVEDPDQLGDELNRNISAAEKQRWDAGTVEDWAIESYRVAKNVIYPGLACRRDSDSDFAFEELLLEDATGL